MTSAPSSGQIRIRGARQNNLVGVDVDLPRGALVAITGVSGSGKSSLAFDTLYREGQRRFLETLSAYARQFLGNLQKPEVESVEGLSPAIAVDQKSIPRGSRSTVGTLTEITDHMRVLFARAGVAHCPDCERPVESRTPEALVQEILREYDGRKVSVCAPVVRDRKGAQKPLFEELRKKGFVRARVDGELVRLETPPELERYKRHTIEVVIDRMAPDPAEPGRLREAVDSALDLAEGDVTIVALPLKGEEGEVDGEEEVRTFSTQRACPGCGADVPPLEPRLFSFNSPHGACPTCDGLGLLKRPSEASVVADRELSIRDGALAVTRASGGALLFPKVDYSFLEKVAGAHGFDLDTPWKDLPKSAHKVIFRGAGDERFIDTASWNGERFQGNVQWKRRYKGVLTALEEAWKKGTRRKMVDRYLAVQSCPDCDGSRLRAAARAVRLGELRIGELCALPVEDLVAALDGTELTARQTRIARDLLLEVRRRTEFLLRVGLGYLTLDRAADTLSGGEAQRIRLAAQLGAGLQGVLYVLDEPSIGLHSRDHGRLLGALEHLRDAGNSVIVVEHDEATLRAADYLIDVGPGAGLEGGHIVAAGSPADVAKEDTPTGRLLQGKIQVPAPDERRPGSGEFLEIEGARGFNLKGVDARFPLGTLCAVTGVSGSGKSTLVNRTLAPAALRSLGREAPQPADHDAIRGLDLIDDVVPIDASPIGRTTRSNPATYTKVMGPLRDLFASMPEAKVRGYTRSRFSFNTEGGRCETCGGGGARYVELQFLAPVTVPCEECGGRRFQEETLDVKYRGQSIADVLDMPCKDALELFRDHPKISRQLELMVEVGLGYLTLGQPSTTLSGGEAQRIKLVTHLAKRPRGHTLYLLDEPTTGLHMEDVGRLVGALQKLVDLGHTVLVVEHNLELVQAADHVLDMGPEGGNKGGELLVTGTPEVIAATKNSATGEALRGLDDARAKTRKGKSSGRIKGVKPSTKLVVEGARTHNLKGVDISIPRDSLTVFTGPSGSGKSSLALDTIYTEGRRRFVESLSTYARQFLGTKDRPPFEKMEGLGPAVAVEARTVGGHPRSTVATTTEIHDHLRVLWARGGTPVCPDHGEKLESSDAGKIAKKGLAAAQGAGGDKAKGWVVAPLFGHGKEVPEDPLEELERQKPGWVAAGFVRLLVDGEEVRLDGDLSPAEGSISVDLVIDRLSFQDDSRARLAEAVEQAAAIAHGRVSMVVKEGPRLEYSTRGACTQCGFQLEAELEPRHFSFNTHVGACGACGGLGARVNADPEKVISEPDLSLPEGAIEGKLGRYLTKGKGYYENLLRKVCKSHRIDINRPWTRLTDAQRALLLHGEGAKESYTVELEKTTANSKVSERFTSDWPGLCGQIDAWHRKTDDPGWMQLLETVMTRGVCGTCKGERLARGPRAVLLGKRRLPELLGMTVTESLEWLGALKLRAALKNAVEPVIAELKSRVSLLERVGLGYLTLDRSTSTLSGGEARRVRLSASLGSELVGVCYVLDEPTVGLHPRDVERLAGALEELRDRGNTVLVVEHDSTLMRRADWIVDLGPGAGEHGGTIVASSTPEKLMKHKTSGTAAHLRGEVSLMDAIAKMEDEGLPAKGTFEGLPTIRLYGAKTNNLQDLDLEVHFGRMTGLCGPSGSGKSTLVLDTLVPAMKGEASGGRWSKLLGAAGGGLRTVVVDAAPIGRTPHSVPATYVGLMDPIRELFARTPEARLRGMGASSFSFNSTHGRCPACEGRGSVQVEMQFLADLWLVCEECDGQRFLPAVLEVRHRGKSIADVLNMSVDQASEYLEHQPKALQVLAAMSSVGLGYLRLGQSSTTLSGGEAQRVKLAAELVRATTGGRSVVVLDEPSTGLAATDTVHLARALARLARRGNAVVLIEHNVELLAVCDRLIELGPDGGAGGGRIIAEGTPEELVKNKTSVTGPFLRMDQAKPAKKRAPKKKAAAKKSSKKAGRKASAGSGGE